ncbi:rod shape-determining protein RodA [Sulfurihydrogenibium subterraneum]|uniref:rod shape-determining protein RodA n=1 Tax=Sulfurihydrogenibium subterraneum TaxID=171121 RepID=UPI00048B8792|nr:rod shape-determining protein RodA [Sulfurihydrogenibium subterraneum]
MKELIFEKLKKIDVIVFFIALFLIIFSIFNIYSASYHEFSNLYIKQIIFAVFSFFIILTTTFLFDYRWLSSVSFYLYGLGIFLLVLVKFIGTTILGAKRWINLGFFQLQPSEVMKSIMIFFSANYISSSKLPLSFKDFLKLMLFSSIPFVLIYTQPDLGSGIMLLLPVFAMVFLAGFKLRYIIGFALVLVLISPLVWTHLKDYQKNRIIAILNPEADPKGTAYHIIQSKIAIGSGMLTGKGYLQGSQSKYYFLPEQHTDFIFATIGEEWGFVVSFLLVSLYLVLSLRIFFIGRQLKDMFGKFICYGVASLIAFQSFINIAMNLAIAPVVGVPLPFLSYGGTALIMFSFLIGLVLNISYINSKQSFQLYTENIGDY